VDVNARRLAQVGLGLIGIWLLAQTLTVFATIARIGGIAGGGAFFFAAGVPFLLMLGFSYVLVFHNASLARAIAPDPAATIESNGTDIARVLFALMGVLLLSEAIPAVLNLLVAVAISANQEYSSVNERAAPVRGLFAAAVKGGIGWYLIAKPERLLEIVRRPLRDSTD
jgi:hypothetical protein